MTLAFAMGKATERTKKVLSYNAIVAINRDYLWVFPWELWPGFEFAPLIVLSSDLYVRTDQARSKLFVAKLDLGCVTDTVRRLEAFLVPPF